MLGQCKGCGSWISECSCTTTTGSIGYGTIAYGAPFGELTPLPLESPLTDIPTYLPTYSAPDEHIRSEEEIRELLSKIFMWLSGMSEYPDELREIFDPGVVGEPEDEPDDLIQCPEKSAVQILRWVLKEIDLP